MKILTMHIVIKLSYFMYDLKWKMIYFDEILNYMNGSLPVFLVARKCTRSTYPTWPIVLLENMIW